MDFDTCCAYCCTGFSVFGVVGLVSMPSASVSRGAASAHRVHTSQIGFGIILQSGGNWYLGIDDENSGAAATGCFIAALFYAGYVALCGLRVRRMIAAQKQQEITQGLIDRRE